MLSESSRQGRDRVIELRCRVFRRLLLKLKIVTSEVLPLCTGGRGGRGGANFVLE